MRSHWPVLCLVRLPFDLQIIPHENNSHRFHSLPYCCRLFSFHLLASSDSKVCMNGYRNKCTQQRSVFIWLCVYRASYRNVLMTNEMHKSYNQFLFHSFLSALHVSNESSRSSSGARHNILYCTVWYNRYNRAYSTVYSLRFRVLCMSLPMAWAVPWHVRYIFGDPCGFLSISSQMLDDLILNVHRIPKLYLLYNSRVILN